MKRRKGGLFLPNFSSLNIHTKIIETMPLENSPSNRFYSPLFSRRLRPGLKITRGWFDRGRYNTNPNNAKQCGIKGLWGEILQFYHTFVVCHFPPKMGHLMIPLHPFLPVILSFLANGEAPFLWNAGKISGEKKQCVHGCTFGIPSGFQTCSLQCRPRTVSNSVSLHGPATCYSSALSFQDFLPCSTYWGSLPRGSQRSGPPHPSIRGRWAISCVQVKRHCYCQIVWNWKRHGAWRWPWEQIIPRWRRKLNQSLFQSPMAFSTNAEEQVPKMYLRKFPVSGMFSFQKLYQ